MLHRPWVTEAKLSLTSPTKYKVFNIPYAFDSLDHRSLGTWLDDLEDPLGQSLILNVTYAEFGFTPNTR
jgi:hypothetical protein